MAWGRDISRERGPGLRVRVEGQRPPGQGRKTAGHGRKTAGHGRVLRLGATQTKVERRAAASRKLALQHAETIGEGLDV